MNTHKISEALPIRLIVISALLFFPLSFLEQVILRPKFVAVANFFSITACIVILVFFLAGFLAPRGTPASPEKKSFRISIALFFAWLCLAFLVTWLFAPSPLFGTYKIFEIFVAFGASLFVAKAFRNTTPSALRSILVTVLAMGAISACTALVVVKLNPSLLIFDGHTIGFTNFRTFGALLGLSIMAGVGPADELLFRQKDLGKGLLLTSLIVVCWIVLLWTGTRGALLSVFAAILVAATLQWRVWRILAVSGLTAIVGGFVLQVLDLPSIGGTITREFNNVADINQFSSNRIDLWFNDWIPAAMDRPIFGHGYAQTNFLPNIEHHFQHTHNIVVEIFLSTGLLGVVLLCGSLLLVLWRVLKSIRKSTNSNKIAPQAAILYLFAYSMLDGPWYFEEVLIPAILICGLSLAMPPKYESQSP